MEPRIGHWHCRYRLVGAQTDAAQSVERLERAIRPRVLEAYGNALTQAFENDTSVYILRRVNTNLMLGGVAAETEITLAHKWGNLLGAAVARSIATHDGDSSNLVRFEDEAEYVAHFIADLLDELAWQRWYYGPFSRLRGHSKRDAILSLLVEHRETLAVIFRHLARLGGLNRVLALLEHSEAATLWAEAIQPTSGDNAALSVEEFRLFVRSAMRLLDRLGLWDASSPTESELLESYVAERPFKPDWGDRRSLAAAVLNVVRYAQRRAYLRRQRQDLAQQLLHAREYIFAELDWLDIEWLEAMLLATLAGESATSPQDALPLRLIGPTPLQSKLLERIRELLRDGLLTLDQDEVDSPVNAMRIYARLAAADCALAAEPAAALLIESLLLCAKWIKRTPEPDRTLVAMRAGSANSVFELLPGAAHAAIQTALSLGPTATEVLAELVCANGDESKSVFDTVLPTECAGLFLLIRALQDARIPQLSETTGAGPLSSVLLALGIQWAGPQALLNGEIDPGLAFWCGLAPQAHTASELLSALDVAGCQRLLAEVSELFRHRCALDSSLARVEPFLPEDSLAALAAAWPTGAHLHEALALVAAYALRLWAQWLPALSGSSAAYLLSNLVRRSGVIQVRAGSIEVILRPAPLDIVLEMASYMKELSKISWLEDRKVVFRSDRS